MENIKLENLEINGFHLYQDKSNFNFGIDAVLLSNFVLREAIHTHALAEKKISSLNKKSDTISNSKRTFNICDLCTGTLPIPLIIYAKSMLSHSEKGTTNSPLHIDAFEIDREQVSLCNKSILWNKTNISYAKNIDSDIIIYNDDIKNIYLDKNKYKNLYESYDIVTVNPPYNKKGSGLTNLNDKKTTARHEISITFEEICKVANLILKSNKKLYLIHQTNRFTEIVETLKKYSFAVKKICFIHPYANKPSNLFLLEANKCGNSGVKILPPIIIYKSTNIYTDEVLKIYGK